MKTDRILAFFAVGLMAIGVIGTYAKKEVQNNIQPIVEITAAPTPETEPRSVTVTATGDCTFATDDYAVRELGLVTYAEKYGTSYFFENVRDIFAEDDLTIINFEGTLSDRGTREIKQFAFRGDPSYTDILTSSSVEVANLANNHSMDYGEISLSDTKMHLDNAGILHCRDTDDICITEVNGIKVGLVGINYLNDVMKTHLEEAIISAKDMGAEIIILSIHWGAEKATSPSEEQVNAAHTAIDMGADLVIGNHPHVLQGIEKYKGRYICYSLGNFCFGGNNAPSDMDTVLFRQTLTLTADGILDDDMVEIIPCSISESAGFNDYQPTPSVGSEKERIANKLTAYTDALDGPQLKFR